MLNMFITCDTSSQSLPTYTHHQTVKELSVWNTHFCVSHPWTISSRKLFHSHIQQPFSPTLLLLIQAHVHDLFATGTVHTNMVPINTQWHYFLKAEIPCLKEIHCKAFFYSILPTDNEDLLYLQFSLCLLGQTEQHGLLCESPIT